MLNNKKAQTGEALTWIIATIIIIATLLIFVYASSLLAQKMKISHFYEKASNFFHKKPIKETDWAKNKNMMAFLINNENKQAINGWISKSNI